MQLLAARAAARVLFRSVAIQKNPRVSPPARASELLIVESSQEKSPAVLKEFRHPAARA